MTVQDVCQGIQEFLPCPSLSCAVEMQEGQEIAFLTAKAALLQI